METDQPRPKGKRDPSATKERLLRAGLAEFGQRGFGGARTASIAESADCNIRMLYHYFGDKEGLYLACLERVYSEIRSEEQRLQLGRLEPVEAVRRLVEFTYDHMRNHPDFVKMATVENTERGRFISRLPQLAAAAEDLVVTIGEILDRGARCGQLREGIDPFQLYVSILSLSYLHLSNRYTLSVTYGRDLGDGVWLERRRQHVIDLVLAYVVKG
jgi:AcrR family transcriptional regulator